MQEELTKIYRRAQREIKAKLKNWQEKYQKDAAKLQEKLQNGQITPDEYRDAMQRLAFRGKLWDQKLDQITGVLANANAEALQIINDEKMGVFADGANWQSYQITKDTGMALNFSVYDQDAVGNLLKNEPQLLPRKKLDTAKDKAWNQRKIAGAVAQGIIQGESIPQLAGRIAADTASINGDAMIRYARTAMTGAQNAGRFHTLQRAEAMGIKCKKCWLATLDSRTRDSHRDMDGVKVGINEKFHTPLGSEMLYPGDVAGKPGDIWNCRCTMTYEYDGFEPAPENNDRIQYDDYYTTYKDKDGKTHKVYHRSGSNLIKDMTYNEWKRWKKSEQEQSEQEESGYSFRNMPRSMEADKYDQWVKSHSTRANAKEDEQLLDDLWMAESNPGGIHYVQSADGSSAINGYWRNDGAITYAGKWDRTVRPGDKVPSKLQAIYEKDSKSIRETSEAMDRLIQFGRSDREMALERWSGADALKRLGIDIGSGKTQRFGHARITDGLNHQDIVDQINQTLKGAVISDKGYSSASVSSERNVFIGSDIKFTIIAPEGTPMYITENTAESEVILARKTEMEVIGARVIDTKARRNEWNGETTEKETKTVEILVKLLQ